MKAIKTLALALCALTVGGCSLLWTPDYGPDAAPFDANEDANIILDAGVDGGPDAFRRTENCSTGGDEDGNGLSNCDDPACYGSEQCCTPSSATPVRPAADFAMRPLGWSPGRLASVDNGLLLFGTGGSFVRNACIPLVEGVRIEVPIVRVAASSGVLRLVLSPAAAAGPSGFVDEVAIQFGGDSVQAFRAGMPQPMPAPEAGRACAGAGAPVRTATSLSLPGVGQTIRLRLEVRPGLVGGRSVILVNGFLDASTYPDGACNDPQPILRDAVVDLRDLVTTGACSGTPGLFLALEGTGATFAIRDETAPGQLALSTYECASPGVFRVPMTETLGRTALGTVPMAMPPAVEPAAGGIGAPSLTEVSEGTWLLSFDGSEEDRASEVFAPITTRLFQSSAAAPEREGWTGRPGDRSQPVTIMASSEAIPGSFREPHQLDDDLYFSALTRIGVDAGVGIDAGGLDAGVIRPTYAIFRANENGDGDFGSPVRLALSGCADYREVVVIGTERDRAEFFYRCDNGAASTVGMSVGSNRIDSNILGMAYASRRVRALDVLRTGDQLALWVLFEGTSGAELHLFLASAAPESRPTFTPFVGNPVLVESELREAGTCIGGEACSLSSFTVARDGTTLHFYFARRRGATYELALRTQPAPPSLRAP